MPGANDTLRYSDSFFDTLTAANLAVAGENVTWDFSHLRPIRQGVKDYERALFTPYAFFFLGFNQYGVEEFESIGFGDFQFEDVYQFYRRNRNDFRAEGIGLRFRGLPIPAYYTDEDEIYQFPLSFGDLNASTYSFQLGLEQLGLVYESVGTRTNEVDSWGTIITPYGTFECIRVIANINSTDSVKVGDFAFGLPNNRIEYKWLAKDRKMPVLEISGNEVAERFIPTRIRYRDRYRDPSTFVEQFAPVADFTADNLSPTLQDTVTFTSNSDQLAVHAWQFNPPSVTYVNGTNSTSRDPQVVFDAVGKYDVTLGVNNVVGDSDTTRMEYIEVRDIASSLTTIAEAEVTVFPNPTNDWIQIRYNLPNSARIQIQLFDSQGRLISSLLEATKIGQQTFDVNLMDYHIQQGIYWLKLDLGSKTVWRKVVL